MNIILLSCVLSPSPAILASLQELSNPIVTHLTVLGPLESRLEDASLRTLTCIIKDLENKELHLMLGPCVLE